MKYEEPEEKNEEEVSSSLSRVDLSPEERVRVVISALYYGNSIEFSGDILLNEFSRASTEEKYLLRGLFETFYGMCRTTYRIDDSISMLKIFKINSPEISKELDCTIEALVEYKEIFKSR